MLLELRAGSIKVAEHGRQMVQGKVASGMGAAASDEWRVASGERREHPPPRVFLSKSSYFADCKGVEVFGNGKEFAIA